ncbi:MAG: alpha/beta hydrolase [Bacteroidota bacterium]
MPNRKEELIIGGIRAVLNGTARLSPRRAGKLGYRLLCRPRRRSLDPIDMDFVNDSIQKKITLAGIPTQTYHWPGDGPGVLLLHGWESQTGRWSAYYTALKAAGFSIYAFDAPAHGKSGGDNFTVIEYAAVMKAYLECLDDPPVNWVGHSGGGMAIFYYLSEMEYRIKPNRIVAMSVPAELTDFLNIVQRVLQLKRKVVDGIEQEFTRRMNLSFKDISPRRYAKKVNVPGLIIHDVGDELAPIEGAEDIYQNWKNSSLIITEGLGHTLTGVEVVELITEYMLLDDSELQGA